MSIPATPFQVKSDKELRSRVKLLGKLVGNVLLKHEAPEVFHGVESLRTGFIQLRKRDSEAKRKNLMKLINGLEPAVISQVVRAFTLYFNLVNIAEEDYLHRLRRNSVQQQGHAAWVGSFYHTLEEFKDQGIGIDDLQAMCDRLLYKPVFTAHPTESRRRTVMHHQREVFKIIDQLTDPRLSQFDRDDLIDTLQLQIETLWLTNEVRASKPTVIDEIKMGLHYFQRSLYEAVKVDYRYLERAVLNTYGEGTLTHNRLATACYPEHGLPMMLCLAVQNRFDLESALLAYANAGGDNVHRGMVLGLLVGAASEEVPAMLKTGLVDHVDLATEIEAFSELAVTSVAF